MPSKTVLHIICAAFIALMRTADASADITLNFPTNNNDLTCNGVDYSISPATCAFDDNKKIDVRLKSWGGYSSILTLDTNPDTVTISGYCVQSWEKIPNTNDNYSLNPVCQPPPPPPPANGETLLEEWFADLPWHQKLSTKDSNLIDVPFVLPFAAITRCKDILDSPKKERCMLRYGIVNVMAMHRTDKLYSPDDAAPGDQDCSDGKCVEVKIEVERVHTNTDDARGYARDNPLNLSQLKAMQWIYKQYGDGVLVASGEVWIFRGRSEPRA